MVSANASAMSEVKLKCQPCNKSFKTKEMMEEHKKSKKHKKSEKEYLAENPDKDSESMFQSISMNTDKSIDQQALFTGEEKDVLKVEENIEQPKSKRKTTLESLRCCLFCNKES